MTLPAGHGLFVTFEGGEGVGKSTQLRRLAAALQARGLEVVETREPGGTPEAERLRMLVLDATHDFDPMEQVLLLQAARHHHLRHVIRPALGRGAIVLCDRFADSTLAYQGAAGGVDAAVIAAMHRLALDDTRPDLTIVLDAPPETGLARAARRGQGSDRFEAADLEFHRRLRQAFLDIAAAEPGRCIVVDSSGDAEAAARAVLAEVEARLG